MRKVRLLDRVEDSNVFTDESEAAAIPNPRSVLGPEVRQGDRFISVPRVDYFAAGEVVELADWQAANLVDLGFAETAA